MFPRNVKKYSLLFYFFFPFFSPSVQDAREYVSDGKRTDRDKDRNRQKEEQTKEEWLHNDQCWH